MVRPPERSRPGAVGTVPMVSSVTNPPSAGTSGTGAMDDGTSFGLDASLKVRINDNVTSTVTINLTATYELRNNNGNNSSPTPKTRARSTRTTLASPVARSFTS